MRRLLSIAMLVLAACERQGQQPGSPPTTTTTTTEVASVSAAASASDSASTSTSASAPSAPATSPLVDAAALPGCALEYSCGLSHPGLGSSANSSSIDFSKCSRTVSSSSGPYEPSPMPLAADASTSSSKTTALSAAECAHIRQLLLAITEADMRAAQESAHMDSTACSLTLTCRAPATPTTPTTPTSNSKFSVQRQSFNGPSRVEQLIRAVLHR